MKGEGEWKWEEKEEKEGSWRVEIARNPEFIEKYFETFSIS